MRSALLSVLLAPTALVVLAGCPSSYGFRGYVLAPKVTTVRVIAAEPTPEPGITDVAPVANAQVTCEGCDEKPMPLEVDATGRFGVSLGWSYRQAKPIVLHVSAPGYAPMDVEIATPPHDSQLGYGALYVVLKRQ